MSNAPSRIAKHTVLFDEFFRSFPPFGSKSRMPQATWLPSDKVLRNLKGSSPFAGSVVTPAPENATPKMKLGEFHTAQHTFLFPFAGDEINDICKNMCLLLEKLPRLLLHVVGRGS